MNLGEQLEVLKLLTFVQEQLIAQVHPVITVNQIRGRQLGYRRQAINFSQDVNLFICFRKAMVKTMSSSLLIDYE